MVDKKKEIPPIDAIFEDVVDSLISVEAASLIASNIKYLGEVSPIQAAPEKQLPLDLGIQVERDINGIEMGVLENGLPYLTQKGLANITGAARSTIYEITAEWEQKIDDPILGKGRNDFLKDYLFKNGYNERTLYLELLKSGSVHYAYPDIVCMAILEHYAFEAQKTNETALKNYRNLARFGLQKFIYEALEYAPVDKWKYFTDRISVLKDASPPEHFIVFNETTPMAADLINADLPVNDKTVPDISVGMAWAKFWVKNELDGKFKPRIKYEHNYPDYYPQARSNPQTPWAYPDAALPLFRRWFKNEYLLTKFPRYILGKANILKGGKLEAEQIAALFDQKIIEG